MFDDFGPPYDGLCFSTNYKDKTGTGSSVQSVGCKILQAFALGMEARKG